MPHTPFLIIGGGPAGYTAGIYGARAGLSPLLVEGPQPGGQLTITTDVENWPGHTSIQGPELMLNLAEHARAAGVAISPETVDTLTLDNGQFQATLSGGSTITATAVLLATGAVAKWLGIPGEEEWRGYGVSACATCDGFFFKDRTVVVIGGGNTAMEEALFLTHFAHKVLIVHRRNALRGERILQERVLAHPKIEVLWNTQPLEVQGEQGNSPFVTGLLVRHDGHERTVACDGIFVAIGHSPASQLAAGLADLNPDATVWVEPGSARTSLPGLFAAGDVADSRYRQAITSAGMGCAAALDAERWITHTTPPL